MELSPRKRAVLEAIVRAYIETGEPIGSKILTGLMENAPSSATLRNEMSELCELGFLEQPHVSAGRVPTENAYKLFVEAFMKPAEMTESAKRYIDSALSSKASDPEQICSAAAQLLSDLTGFTAFSYSLTDKEATLKKIELMPISRHSAILFFLTSDGHSKSKVCRLSEPFSTDIAEGLKLVFDKNLRRKPLSELNKAYLQNVIASAGLDSFSLVPLLTAVFDMAADASESKVYVSGSQRMYNLFSEEKAQRIQMLLSRNELIVNLCEKREGSTEIIFGDDTGFSDLKNTTTVVCRYNVNNQYGGRIGIIGSDRMSYEQIVSGVEYIASRLSKLMTEVQKDMED